MAQTKRKRKTKHRGNAVGRVEARGRTSKPPAGAPAKNGASATGLRSAARQQQAKPPTVQAAFFKALFGVAILFVFFRFLSGRGNSTAEALSFCAVALVLYVPVMYMTDKFIYNRRLKQQAAGTARR